MKKTLIAVGAVLLLLGIAALIHPEFTYNKKDEVLKVGSIEATVERRQSIQIPRAAPALMAVAGLGVFTLGLLSRK